MTEKMPPRMIRPIDGRLHNIKNQRPTLDIDDTFPPERESFQAADRSPFAYMGDFEAFALFAAFLLAVFAGGFVWQVITICFWWLTS